MIILLSVGLGLSRMYLAPRSDIKYGKPFVMGRCGALTSSPALALLQIGAGAKHLKKSN